jgi:hypothetical protein
MNTEKLTAILNKADPAHNSNYQERQVALNIAHKMMDQMGISYAFLGYSQADAERIENQFSVTSGHAGNASGYSRTGYRWWNPFTWGEAQEESTEQTKQAKPKKKRYNDGNGREWDPSTGNWEYTADKNGNANPNQCNYEPATDYQGPVPSWDGYSGDS